MKDDITKAVKWTQKWRVNINLDKTEICIFSKKNIDEEDKRILIQGKELKYNSTPKLLGIIMDEKMTFSKHIDAIEKRANRNLTILREVRQISKLKTEKLLQLYYSLVRSVMEYCSPAWQIAEPKDLQKLDRVQRKALILCMDMPTTSGREALEVESGVMPIDLRLEQIAIKEIAKIKSKSAQEPIKQQLVRYEEHDAYDKYPTPMGKALSQAAEMEKQTKININLIEPEFTYRLGETQMTQSKPLYWSRLGNSKSRTNEQQELCQETINQLMGDCTQEQAISFTDGSCLGNPGPCGAGAIIYAEHIKPAARLHRPVAQRGSILLAELIAILMVLEYCITENIYNAIQRIKIFSDSQSAVGLLTLNWAPNSYISVIREIKENIEHLRQKGLNVIVAWTPGHANIVGNDEADILAKTAAEEAKELPPENNVITLQDVKQAAYKSTGNKWQRRWEISERGRDLYEKIPTTKHSIMYDFPTKRHFSIFAQLRTGYTELNYYKNRVGQTNAIESCNCGAPETPQHFLLECPYYEKEREDMLHQISKEVGVRNLNLATMLTRLDGENTEETKAKLQTVAHYIDRTGRFNTAVPQSQS
ncbi:unnamed protein product [Mytilus edulis]|uniref:RNase H type-1 domain-containing protein n=1 Tax=Mytilus edulis TaxID=6550 RepID=A0A8S3VN94_MYTED|nr:unnamed protein product [Mytilus edulis]